MVISKEIDSIVQSVKDNWRANDGGMTEAAGDVIHTANWAKDLLYKYHSGAASKNEVIWKLEDAWQGTSTGSEMDILDAAMADMRGQR